MRKWLVPLLAVCVLSVVALLGCAPAEEPPASDTTVAGDAASTAKEPMGEPVEITGPADLAGEWTATWNDWLSVGTDAPKVWAEGTVTFAADSTFVSDFTPVTDEPPVHHEEEFDVGTEFDRTIVAMYGRPYFAELIGDTLTLTAYSDDGTADPSPTFVMVKP